MNNIWKQFIDQAKKLWGKLTKSKPPNAGNSTQTTLNNKWNHISGQWARYRGKAKEEWGELTNEELTEANGHFEVLAAKIQERYGIEQEEANKQIDMWTANLII